VGLNHAIRDHQAQSGRPLGEDLTAFAISDELIGVRRRSNDFASPLSRLLEQPDLHRPVSLAVGQKCNHTAPLQVGNSQCSPNPGQSGPRHGSHSDSSAQKAIGGMHTPSPRPATIRHRPCLPRGASRQRFHAGREALRTGTGDAPPDGPCRHSDACPAGPIAPRRYRSVLNRSTRKRPPARAGGCDAIRGGPCAPPDRAINICRKAKT